MSTKPGENVSVTNQQLQSQIKILQRDMEAMRAEMEKKLEDTNQQSHDAKHGMLNVKDNLVGFKNEFEKYGDKLTRIYETLLSSNFEKRIGEVESHCKLNSRVKEDLEAVKTRVTAVELQGTQGQLFQNSIMASLKTIQFIGVGVIIAMIIGAVKLWVK